MVTSDEVQAVGIEQSEDVWIARGDARLFARRVGIGARGTPLVFFHGGLADHRAALFRVGALAATRTIVAPDLRGSGRSVFRGALSWDALADDAEALVAHMDRGSAASGQVIVGGTSMGSGVAIRFALRYPRRVRALLLLSPVYPGADQPLAAAPEAAMRRMGEVGARVADEGVEALLPLFEALPAPIRDVAIDMMRGFDPGSVAATTRFLASNAQPMEAARDLASIDAPVLLVPGTDPEHPAEIAGLYARHLRQAQIADPSDPDLMGVVQAFCARACHEG